MRRQAAGNPRVRSQQHRSLETLEAVHAYAMHFSGAARAAPLQLVAEARHGRAGRGPRQPAGEEYPTPEYPQQRDGASGAGIPADDRRRFDFVLYGAARRGEALCCDVALVSPLRADGSPQPGSRDRDGGHRSRTAP